MWVLDCGGPSAEVRRLSRCKAPNQRRSATSSDVLSIMSSMILRITGNNIQSIL
jgi:hypothetical protein